MAALQETAWPSNSWTALAQPRRASKTAGAARGSSFTVARLGRGLRRGAAKRSDVGGYIHRILPAHQHRGRDRTHLLAEDVQRIRASHARAEVLELANDVFAVLIDQARRIEIGAAASVRAVTRHAHRVELLAMLG